MPSENKQNKHCERRNQINLSKVKRSETTKEQMMKMNKFPNAFCLFPWSKLSLRRDTRGRPPRRSDFPGLTKAVV